MEEGPLREGHFIIKLSPMDISAMRKFAMQIGDYIPTRIPKQIKRRSKSRYIKYSDLLKDPRWQRKRLQILNAANFTCQSCGSDKKTLHVHHKYYTKGKPPWEYEDDVFEVLCHSCHSFTHQPH